jgi:putative ABC transport system permease protein
MIWTAVAIAANAIRRHVLRSTLTVLGVVIGVWSVVTMVTLGGATTDAVRDSITSLGSNLLTVTPGRGFGRGGGREAPALFDANDIEAVRTQISGIDQVAPTASAQAVAVLNAANWQTAVTGVTRAYFDVQQWSVAEGRGFTAEEESSGRSVCLLGDTVREKLAPDIAVVGLTVRVGAVSCVVIGALAKRGQGFGANPDDSVFMPIKAVQRRLTGNRDIASIIVAYDTRFDPSAVKDNLTALMRDRRYIGPGEDDDFSIFDARQIADTVSTTTGLLTALLSAVGAVSLVVGGIGIMNIMLVSVTERTREIGIRLAVGALSKDVLMQFLIEAVVLSALGGLVGLVLASATTYLVAPLIGVPFRFDIGINVAAFILSASIGVLFGFVPARRAARLDPIEALRHE